MLLRLKAGDVVIDAGCGTGKSLSYLSHAVGQHGKVIAIEPCEPMRTIAHAKIRHEGLHNVQLVGCAVENFDCTATGLEPHAVDAVLLMFTHDVLQSAVASAALMRAAKPGARFALTGGKYFSGPLALLNPWVHWRQRRYCTTFEGYSAPWRKFFAHPALAQHMVAQRYGGIAYVASAICDDPSERS